MTKMSLKKQLITCTICLEDIELVNEAILDSCSHKFCGPCIFKWVQEMENKCPLCKTKIHKISYRDILGRLQD